MEPRIFPMEPVSASSLAWLWGIMAVTVLALLGLTVMMGWSLHAARYARFELSSEGLRIRADIYGRMIPGSSLVKEAARRVDLAPGSEFRPRWRTNGLGLPGYQAGWFKLSNGEKALLFLSDRGRAVYIPTRDGYALILSPADPGQFIAELKAM